MKKTVRILMIFAGVFFLLLFIAPLFAHILNIGNALGMAGSALLILWGIFFNPLTELKNKIKSTKKGKFIFNISATGVIAAALSFFIALGATLASSITNADGQKTVIVLGCAVMGDQPSWMLLHRIESAYEYLEENPDSVAILSGGQGDNEDISEAQCMFNVLTEKGIDENRLYLEDKSTDTFENITFSKQIIDSNELSTDVAIASSNFHLKRATMVAEKQGLTAKRISAKTSTFLTPTYYVRDTLGVILEFIVR